MKKLKLFFISIAIVMGVGGAFASNLTNCATCYNAPQYRQWNGTYIDVDGEEGLDYACIGGAGICTYYKPSPSSPYLPCQIGIYVSLWELNSSKKK